MCNSYSSSKSPLLKMSQCPRKMPSTANSQMEVLGCPRCVYFLLQTLSSRSRNEKGFRAVQDVQGIASLPGIDLTIANDCLKCWFRPCLTHWKNSAMKTTLVVRIQLCPFIWHLQWSTLLIGWVNKATIAHAHSANVRLGSFCF